MRQTITGKAFEYACLISFKESITEAIIKIGAQFDTAKRCFEALSDKQKEAYMSAARTAVRIILPLEPRLKHGTGEIFLQLSTDSAGIEGDVRDLICIRVSQSWEIGISCKHNHEALKHPRITRSFDFGSEWINIPCSRSFTDKMGDILGSLNGSVMWRDIPNKKDSYYLPVLNAYVSEIISLCEENPTAPEKMIKYFFGINDFYKVIAQERIKQTKIMAFNVQDTMNKPAGETRSIFNVHKLRMPTRLIEARVKERSSTTILLTFDNGWGISMRLHNKDDIAKITSLAWDVSLSSLPPTMFIQTRSWDDM